MTVVAKRIKTATLNYSAEIAATGDVDLNAADEHVWLEDVTVVGVLLRTTLRDGDFGWDSGRFTILAEVSRIAKMQQAGTIVAYCNHLICREATVGINANQTMVGNPEERQLVMFTEGYGIDMDEGTALYLNQSVHNGMANIHYTSAFAIIYYVER